MGDDMFLSFADSFPAVLCSPSIKKNLACGAPG